MPPWGGVSGMSIWEDSQGMTSSNRPGNALGSWWKRLEGERGREECLSFPAEAADDRDIWLEDQDK